MKGPRDEGLSMDSASMASDAIFFFPFRDGLDVAAEFASSRSFQPGGSKRGRGLSSAAADEHGIAMVFTGCGIFATE